MNQSSTAESRSQVLPVDALNDAWNDEHADLTQYMQQAYHWLSGTGRTVAVSELVIWMQGFRERLLRHFEREEELGEQFQMVRNCVEMAASRRQLAVDHQNLARRLDSLITGLGSLELSSKNREHAIDDIGLLIDAVDLHEEQETQSLQWLTARPLDFRKLPR
jgi:hypothetical protein